MLTNEHDPFNLNTYGMTVADKALADELYESMMKWARTTDRALQDADFRIGVSSLGYCSERLRRHLDRQVPDDTDLLKAFIGTWLGAGFEAAVKKDHPDAIIQSEVTIELKGREYTYTIVGHPDLILGSLLLDGKTTERLVGPARDGFEDQQKTFQRHIYGLAAWQEGLMGDVPIEEVRVGNVWIDRSGTDEELLVRTEPLSLDVVDAATEWLDDVVYAYSHGEEARKEPAREVCETTCGFWRTCRAFDTDVSGLITDPHLLDSVNRYVEGAALKKHGEALMQSGRSELADVSGSTGTHAVRWVHVSPSIDKAGKHRNGYSRLTVQEIR